MGTAERFCGLLPADFKFDRVEAMPGGFFDTNVLYPAEATPTGRLAAHRGRSTRSQNLTRPKIRRGKRQWLSGDRAALVVPVTGRDPREQNRSGGFPISGALIAVSAMLTRV